jgi:glycosyltransferase involved in cell wall biosynthesis
MKKVLMVAYYFPPSGGPGVQRVLKFVKYLPEFGWHPVVLTVENGDFPARDESLLAEVPATSTVYRTRIIEPYRFYRTLTGKPADAPVDVENIPAQGARRSPAEKLAGFIRSTLFIPDARIGWYLYAVRRGMEIIRREKIDALYSSSPPYTCALIARSLHLRSGLPWIAGFRDPWTDFLTTPKRWFFPRMIDRRLEESVFADATMIEAAWSGIIADFRKKYPEADFSKCVHLPNGFDPADYPKIKKSNVGPFTVVYTGSMYGKRNPQAFLKAVEELVREKKVDTRKIRLRFIGRFGSEVRAMFASSSIRSSIEVVDYLPHAESIQELLQAGALLLVVDEAKESEEIVPGKVFEYVGAQRPIIALAPEGAVAQLLRETNAGVVARHQDIPAIKRAFLECYRNFLYHRKNFRPNRAAMKQYERKEITRRLAQLLDSAARSTTLT